MEKMRPAHCASKRSGRLNRPRSRQRKCAAGGRYGAIETALLAAVTACAVAGPVAADSIGPGTTFDPDTHRFGDFFTPPLSASQSTSIPISLEVFPGGDINWAGVHFTAIIDPTEANFTGFTPAQGFNITGAAGSVTVWSTNASNSGQSVFSSLIPLGSLALHAKGATPFKNNGDIDVVFQNVFNIWHVTPFSATSVRTFLAATWVYLPPGIPVSQWGQGTPPQVGGGSWVHLTATHTVHFSPSWFWGTSGFFNPGASGGIGIENVPAPASAAILIGGFGAFGFARRRRRV